MSEVAQEVVGSASAGAMLRAAREKQGMHVAALAASIKITVAKLEALENDRFDQLPDATFTRALALTVCRALKIEPEPVLAKLPQGGATGLGKVTGGLNMPFRDRPGRSDPGDFSLSRRPMLWMALLVLLAALVVYLLPSQFWHTEAPPTLSDNGAAVGSSVFTEVTTQPAAAPSPPTAASAASAAGGVGAASADQPLRETVPPAPAVVAGADAVDKAAEPPDKAPGEAATPTADAPDQLVLRSEKASWVQVLDGQGTVLIRRTLQAGESVKLDGHAPLQLTIGNAATTKVEFRGKAVDLTATTVGNVARLQLK